MVRQDSAPKMGNEPEEEREAKTEEEAGDDWKIKGGMFTAVDDVAGESAETERKFSAEVKKGADEDKEAAENEEGAAEFA